jgi:hypothetical protein
MIKSASFILFEIKLFSVTYDQNGSTPLNTAPVLRFTEAVKTVTGDGAKTDATTKVSNINSTLLSTVALSDFFCLK